MDGVDHAYIHTHTHTHTHTKKSIYFVVTSKSSVLVQVWVKIIYKTLFFFFFFNSTAVSLGKPPKPQTWYIHWTAHSAIYINRKNTRSTVEQSLKRLRIDGDQRMISQNCPHSLRFQRQERKRDTTTTKKLLWRRNEKIDEGICLIL